MAGSLLVDLRKAAVEATAKISPLPLTPLVAAAQTSKYLSVPQVFSGHRHPNVIPANFKPAMLCGSSGSLLNVSGLLSEEDVCHLFLAHKENFEGICLLKR